MASFTPKVPHGNTPALMSAEVVNLSRNIVITGDDFKHVPCDPNLPEAVAGEQTSVLGCRCSSFRNQCTIGLHTAIMSGGAAKIQNTRIERCGQRGVEGKYLSSVLEPLSPRPHVLSHGLPGYFQVNIAYISTSFTIAQPAFSRTMLSREATSAVSSFTEPTLRLWRVTFCITFAVPEFMWRTVSHRIE